MCREEVGEIVVTLVLLQVKFDCGDKDHVMTLTENEVCQYIVNMMTPAAC